MERMGAQRDFVGVQGLQGLGSTSHGSFPK